MDALARVLITGGRGMLAREVAAALGGGVALTHAECDITSAASVEAALDRCRPTTVINCAAYTAVDACETNAAQAMAVNAEGPGVLARACRRRGNTLVHFGTDFVFDGTAKQPYGVGAATNPLSVYGKSKLEGERQIRAAGDFPWIIIRTSWLFGVGGNCFPRTILELAAKGTVLRVVDDQVGSPTYAADLAEAAVRLVEREARGVFHVTNGGTVSWYGFAQAILAEFAVKGQLTAVSTEEWRRIRPGQAVRPAYSALDNAAYAAATGEKMRPWQEALAAYHTQVTGDR